MIIAYVVNQYPKVSHSFIRREIMALERLGTTVHRYALRDAEIVDERDKIEKSKTYYLLASPGRLLVSLITQCTTNTSRLFEAFSTSLAMMRRSDRSIMLHLVTLIEACLLADRIREDKVAHIHAHFGTNSAELAMLASLLTGIPYSFTVHGPEEFEKAEFIKLRLKVQKAAFVVAISSFCASQLFRWSDFNDWSKMKIVRCGLEQSYATDGGSTDLNQRSLVCIARFSPQKGHLILLEAAAKLVNDGLALQIVLIGDGELRPYIESFIAKHRLEQTVIIVGWASDDQVREHIQKSRALVLTSFAEGLPIVLLEAMAMRKPILGPTLAGIPDVVRDLETGWLFSPGSVDAAAAAMRACLESSEEQCMAMGQNGRQLVLQQHDIDKEVMYLESLFRGGPPGINERKAV